MSANFHLVFKKNNSDLHVTPKGDFDGSSAWELVNLLHDQYDGHGQVYIETRHLRRLCPFGCSTFQCRIHQSNVPTNRLFFKGEKGREIAPEGSRVLEMTPKKKCGCKKQCANCPCAVRSKN